MAEATEKRWGVWFTGSKDQSAGWCSFGDGKPVTYHEAVNEKAARERMYPDANFKVREIPPPDAYDSSTHAADCVCENVCREEKRVEEKSFIKRTLDSCRCGKMTLNSWMNSITDAGNENTDYVKHTRESCLTRTERETKRGPLKPYVPPALRQLPSNPFNFGLDPLGYLCAASQEALAKALFFSDRSIIRHVCEMADYGNATGTVGPFEVPLAPAILKTLERAWELGKAASEDSFTIEALMYRGACETARNIFLLAEGLKAAGSKQI